MRILYVATDADIGGAEVLLETLAEYRRAGDQAALVVLMRRGTLSDRLERAFDTVDYLGFSAGSRNLRAMVRRLEAVIVARQPEVISSHMFHADLVTALAKASGAAKVTTLHTQEFGQGVHPLTRLIARAVGVLSGRFDAVIATSPGAAEFGRRYRYRHEPVMITNGVGMPADASFRPSSRVLLSLARFHPVKGHDVLIDAFARVAPQYPDWTLLCAGPGVDSSNAELIGYVDAAGARALLDTGRIQLHGMAPDPTPLLADAAALIISSRYGEAAPIVGVEALAQGIPVITTDLGVAGEYTEPRFVAEPGSAEDLARAIGEYCALDDRDRAGLSAEARARCAAQFSIERKIDDLDRVYAAARLHRARRRGVRFSGRGGTA